MKILVIGSGGREHAICAAFERSERVSKIFCAPGNAGIADIAECVPIKQDEIEQLAEFVAANGIDLTFVGGETALALGIVDEFKSRGLKIVGASKAAAELEASKSFAKDFMSRHGIPTAKYATAHSTTSAVSILESGDFGNENDPVVVKADGLAAGKGVVVAKDRREAIKAINELEALVGKGATEKIVLEECLFGREVSLLLFADGENFALMPPTRDHKRIGEGDTGPNTGGMGTITDSTLLTNEQMNTIIEQMIKPTLKGCVAEGFPFRGVLFLGIMLAEGRSPTVRKGYILPSVQVLPNGQASAPEDAVPMLLEYNVRFGDPETQSILVRLNTDLVDICEAILDGALDKLPISWRKGNSATVVLAAYGYPEKPRSGDVISGVEKAASHPDISIFHAGTAYIKDETQTINDTLSSSDSPFTIPHSPLLIASGGRVLGVTATANNLPEALRKAYEAAGDISWEGIQFRSDIGKK